MFLVVLAASIDVDGSAADDVEAAVSVWSPSVTAVSTLISSTIAEETLSVVASWAFVFDVGDVSSSVAVNVPSSVKSGNSDVAGGLAMVFVSLGTIESPVDCVEAGSMVVKVAAAVGEVSWISVLVSPIVTDGKVLRKVVVSVLSDSRVLAKLVDAANDEDVSAGAKEADAEVELLATVDDFSVIVVLGI